MHTLKCFCRRGLHKLQPSPIRFDLHTDSRPRPLSKYGYTFAKVYRKELLATEALDPKQGQTDRIKGERDVGICVGPLLQRSLADEKGDRVNVV